MPNTTSREVHLETAQHDPNKKSKGKGRPRSLSPTGSPASEIRRMTETVLMTEAQKAHELYLTVRESEQTTLHKRQERNLPKEKFL